MSYESETWISSREHKDSIQEADKKYIEEQKNLREMKDLAMNT